MTGRMAPDGKVVRSNPQQFGVIRNAHHIKLGKAPEESSVWDSSFEGEFDKKESSTKLTDRSLCFSIGSCPSSTTGLACLNRRKRQTIKSPLSSNARHP